MFYSSYFNQLSRPLWQQKLILEHLVRQLPQKSTQIASLPGVPAGQHRQRTRPAASSHRRRPRRAFCRKYRKSRFRARYSHYRAKRRSLKNPRGRQVLLMLTRYPHDADCGCGHHDHEEHHHDTDCGCGPPTITITMRIITFPDIRRTANATLYRRGSVISAARNWLTAPAKCRTRTIIPWKKAVFILIAGMGCANCATDGHANKRAARRWYAITYHATRQLRLSADSASPAARHSEDLRRHRLQSERRGYSPAKVSGGRSGLYP